jgi:NAD(P)H-hydrate epimerase
MTDPSKKHIRRHFAPIMTAQDTRSFDTYTIKTVGVPSALLIENAGASVAHLVERLLKKRDSFSVAVFVGPGNNGADAIVASRHLLARGFHCTIFFVAHENRFSPDLLYQVDLLRRALKHRGITENSWFLSTPFFAEENSIIIDGIFGAGLSRAPAEKAREAIEFINKVRAAHKTSVVVSIDIPSGLGLEAEAHQFSSIVADVTVTFSHLKRAHISEPTKAMCGKLYVSHIGLFAPYRLTNWYRRRQRSLLSLFNPLAPTAHKGLFGHVLIYEGHPRFLGASRLSGRAALRIGAGLITIGCDKSITPTTLDMPEFMRIKRSDIDRNFMQRIDAVVLGPGLSDHTASLDNAELFLRTWHDDIKFLVLDADGLALLKTDIFFGKTVIIATPHPKEAASLLNCTTDVIEHNRFKAIENLGALSEAQHQNVVWILKGATTLVRALDGEIFAFHGDVPLLATGGSGDILSGAIAGCAKQTASPLAAALLAISLQIEAAQFLTGRMQKGCFASELADLFPVLSKTRTRGE